MDAIADLASMREFFHMLLKRHAEATGQPWPEDCPSPGGWHGGPKEMREGAPEGE